MVSLCSPGCPGTCSIDEAGLKFRDLTASAFMGIKCMHCHHPAMISVFCFVLGFSRQGFSVALVPVLELALVDQTGLELTKIHLPLPPE